MPEISLFYVSWPFSSMKTLLIPKMKTLLNCIKFSLRPSFAIGILAMAAIVGSPDAQAATYTWIATTGSWSGTSNWSPSGTPTVGDEVVRTGGAATINADGPNGVSVGTIRHSGSGQLILGGTPGVYFYMNTGTGAGVASIILNGTAANASIGTSSQGNVFVVDALAITQNNPNSTLGNAIGLTLRGTGNIAFNNVMNDFSRGRIGSGNNIFTVGTMTIERGLLFVQGATPFSGGGVVNLGVTGGSSATLVYYRAGNVAMSNAITVAAPAAGSRNVLGSTIASATSDITTFSGPITLNGDLTVTSQMVQASGSNTGVVLSGVVSGAGGLFINGTFLDSGTNLTTTGGVKVTNAANTFSGDTRIVAGTLFVTNGLALKNSTVDLNSSDSGTLVFGSTTTTGLTSGTFGGLSGSRNLVLQDTLTSPGAVALSIGNNNKDTTYSGSFSGAGSIIKVGSGTLTLAGANLHSGSTTVQAGKLIVSGSIQGSVLNANPGSVLAGTGLIAPTTSSGNAVTISGTLAPGDLSTTGTLNFTLAGTAKLNFAAGSTLNIALGTGNASSTVAFGSTGDWLSGSGNASLALNGTIDYTATYTLFRNINSLFAFSNLASYNTAQYSAVLGMSGNNETLTFLAVPEPSTWAMILGGFGVLTAWQRRSRSRKMR